MFHKINEKLNIGSLLKTIQLSKKYKNTKNTNHSRSSEAKARSVNWGLHSSSWAQYPLLPYPYTLLCIREDFWLEKLPEEPEEDL